MVEASNTSGNVLSDEDIREEVNTIMFEVSNIILKGRYNAEHYHIWSFLCKFQYLTFLHVILDFYCYLYHDYESHFLL